MKLIYYCDSHDYYATNLAISVAAESNEVTLIVRDVPELQGRRNDEALLEGQPESLLIDAQPLAGGYGSTRSVVKLMNLYLRKRKAGYRYFHIQQSGDPRFLWLALRMRTILTLHEPSPRTGVTSGASRWREFAHGVAERLYRRLSDLIVVHTESGLNSLSPSEQKKAIVIPHGVVLRSVLPARESKTILFFGRAAAYKGIDTLLAAMDEVWKVEPDARLRILASPGDFTPVSGLDDRIHATWDVYSRQELGAALSTARAICLPYRSASGTGVGAQAYGSGKPIVASDLDGLRELVVHEELLVQPGSAMDLARALKAVLSKDYGNQAIDEERTWPGVAAAHIRAYRSLSNAAK